jgi:hypothetical protein
MMRGIVEYHRELSAKDYRYMRPGIEEGPAPGSREMGVVDPFKNRITFCQEDGENTET